MSARGRGRRLLLRRLWRAAAGVVVAVLATPLQAQLGEEAAALERRIKAAFVFKFAAFVEWPPEALPEPATPIVIAVMGEEATVQDIAEAASGRTVEGRRVQARQVAPGEPLDGVHILFLRDAAFRRIGGAVAALQPGPMLVVTESAAAIEHGSVVNFVLDQGKVRFDISLDAAEQRGLRLSSRLITVARSVAGRQR